jgi:Skp family chaperone for outer membrane proteins
MAASAPLQAIRSAGLAALAVAGLVLATLMVAGPAAAQQPSGLGIGQVRSPVLVIDSDVLYRESAFGKRILSEIEQERSALASENRQIEADLTAEERNLTDLRAELDPTAFRDLADAFDDKVRAIRREQDGKARALGNRLEENRGAFLTAAAPVLEAMMREAGAAVVLEQRSVFLSLNAIDITDDAIARIDAELGDGAQ